jgi:hypothetical protein
MEARFKLMPANWKLSGITRLRRSPELEMPAGLVEDFFDPIVSAAGLIQLLDERRTFRGSQRGHTENRGDDRRHVHRVHQPDIARITFLGATALPDTPRHKQMHKKRFSILITPPVQILVLVVSE